MLYFMGLNLSNEQITRELDLDPDDTQRMASQLREGVLRSMPEVQLSGEVECDEVYVVAGHKGHPAAVVELLEQRKREQGPRPRGGHAVPTTCPEASGEAAPGVILDVRFTLQRIPIDGRDGAPSTARPVPESARGLRFASSED